MEPLSFSVVSLGAFVFVFRVLPFLHDVTFHINEQCAGITLIQSQNIFFYCIFFPAEDRSGGSQTAVTIANVRQTPTFTDQNTDQH